MTHTSRRLAVMLAVAGVLGACDPFSGIEPELDLCLDGPCGARSEQMPEFVILGFPPAQVDRGAQATGGGLVLRLEVGQSVGLHYVRVPPHGVPLMQATDTLRNVAWSVAGSATTITVGSDGVARLTAVMQGITATVLVDGRPWPMYACGDAPTDACFRVGEISVE